MAEVDETVDDKIVWSAMEREEFIRIMLVEVRKGHLTSTILEVGNVNVTAGETEERMIMTGMHTVVDIFCVGCGSIVGWKYTSAVEITQIMYRNISGLSRTKIGMKLACSDTVPCTRIFLNNVNLQRREGTVETTATLLLAPLLDMFILQQIA